MKRKQFLILAIIFVIMGSIGAYFLVEDLSLEWATTGFRSPQSNNLSESQIDNQTYDATNGAEQVIAVGRGVTTPQSNNLSSAQIANMTYDATNGAKQVILSSNSSDIAFINTTSLTAGDLLYYDATNTEWINTQGYANISSLSTSPVFALKNPTAEDTDGGRESVVIGRGIQSGGEESILGRIQFSHDGTGDDTKGDMIFYTNDGGGLTEKFRLDGPGNATFGTNIAVVYNLSVGLNFTQNSLVRDTKDASVADEASITDWAAINSAGWGFVQAGDNEEYCQFAFSADGSSITLIANSANCVNTDTDTKLCIIDSGGNGIHIKNRLGSAKTLRAIVNY